MPSFATRSMFGVLYPITPNEYALTFDWPMSSPQKTTMFGFFCCAWAAPARATAAIKTKILLFMASSPLPFEPENSLPLRFQADDNPVPGLRLVPRAVELADVRLPVVGELALGVVVVHDQHQSLALAGCGELQHLQVAVGIAERGDRPPADGAVDAERL